MYRRTRVALVGALLAALAVPALTTAAQAGTVVSGDGVVSITVPDVQGLPHAGFTNYPYTVTIANLGGGTGTLTLSMSKVGGGAKTPVTLTGIGNGTVPNTVRTVHLKTDSLNGAGRYVWTASMNANGTVSTASITTMFLAPSEVLITRAPPPVEAGTQYYFTGTVVYYRSAINAYTPVGVATLTLLWRPAGSTTFSPAGTLTTNSQGKFEDVRYGGVSGTWDVIYPGTSSVAASSHTVAVVVN